MSKIYIFISHSTCNLLTVSLITIISLCLLKNNNEIGAIKPLALYITNKLNWSTGIANVAGYIVF